MGERNNYFYKKKCLIIGGLGFIGSNLARKLSALGAFVVIMDSLIPDCGGNLFNIEDIKEKVDVYVSDVREQHTLVSLIKGQDFLFNLAGRSSHLDSMDNPFVDLDINCHAQLSILETCRHQNPDIKIVFTSTRQIYGRPEYLPVDEKHPLRPVDINGINKMAAELYHILYNNAYHIRASALRLTNTYGPGMRIRDARQTFLGLWIRLIVENKTFEVWDGRQLRDFTYVDDVVDAILLTAKNVRSCGQIFNLGGMENIHLKDLAELLVRINGRGHYTVLPCPEERRKIDIGDYYADIHHINNVLQWEPKVPLREGLEKTLSYYHNNLKNYI